MAGCLPCSPEMRTTQVTGCPVVLEPETGLREDELADCECQVEVSWCNVHSVGWDGAAGLELQVSQRENTLPTTESSRQPTCPNPLSRPSGLVLNECAFWERKKQIQSPLVGIFLIFWKAMSLCLPTSSGLRGLRRSVNRRHHHFYTRSD